MDCWKCGASQEPNLNGKLPFRATCDKCFSSLHACINCKNYSPGLPNDCKIPGTEPVRDREAANFCEDFILKGIFMPCKQAPDAISKKLFGDELSPEKDKDPKSRFDSLFN